MNGVSIATITVDAILFDMDGTLIDSTPGVFKAWKTFSEDYHLKNYEDIVHATHGRRLYDTLKDFCKISDEDKLMAEIDRFEDEVIEGGPAALPGAIEMVSALANNVASADKWTIVTSASNKYAPRALERAGVPTPSLGIITSNDVSEGKPHPAPYLAGAAKCGVDPKKCLVIEDAVSGLHSGRDAGAITLAVLTSTDRRVIMHSGVRPDYCVVDLSRVKVDVVEGKLQVTMDQSPIQ